MRELYCCNGHQLDYANQLCNICLERIMPSASDESHEKMRKLFGKYVGDEEPYKYLKDKGYTEAAGLLRPPKPSHLVTTEEWDCISFLCDEWDYGFDPVVR